MMNYSQIVLIGSVFLFAFQFDQCIASSDSYIAAVLSLGIKDETECLLPEYALEISVENYANLVKQLRLKGQRPDIFVFPEGGLQGSNELYPIKVPSANKNIVPCNNTAYSLALRDLSCLAKDENIYLVVNLVESPDDVKLNKTLNFNTNVVFNRKGAIVARYRKININETGYLSPKTQEESYFETDFNVTFGLFTGSDIFFKEPANKLLKTHRVKHFVHPSKWLNELPFFTGIQVQSSWSYATNNVLLSAGYNDPELGYSSSGIYQGILGPIKYSQPESNKVYALIGNVPKDVNNSKESTSLLNKVIPLDNVFKINCSSLINKGEGNKTDKNYLKLKKDNLQLYQTKQITHDHYDTQDNEIYTTAEFNETMCSIDGKFCCKFAGKMKTIYLFNPKPGMVSGDNFPNYNYRLAVYNGIKQFSFEKSSFFGNVQICGIIPCLNYSLESCGMRTDDHSQNSTVAIPPEIIPRNGKIYVQSETIFELIKIEAEIMYKDSNVFPNILLKSSNNPNEFGSLPDRKTFTFHTENKGENYTAKLETNKNIPDLGSISILARIHQIPSSSAKTNFCYLILLLPITMIYSSISLF